MNKITVSKWGNSSALRIPTLIIKKLDIHDGDTLEYQVTDDSLVLKKAHTKKTTRQIMEEFYHMPYKQILESGACTKAYSGSEELDWGDDVGAEVIR